jgi:hypothetical protein
MVIEVNINVIRELRRTRKTNLRKLENKLGGKPTTESQSHWTYAVKTRNDGK